MNRLKKQYIDNIVPIFVKNGLFSNVMDVPRIVKIVINVGFGSPNYNKKVMENIVSELSLISGQKPIVINAKKSIAGFKIRQGVPIGCKVTLRNNRMYDFFDKLLSIILPRVRDFRGLSLKSFDGRGNYSFGIKEQIVFPEVDYDKVDAIRGMDISIITTSRNNKNCEMLLRAFGFPFC